MKKTIQEINEIYDLELDKVVNKIKKSKAKLVLLQFPDGLKLYATTIVDYLEEKTSNAKTEFIIWLDTCYGACDTPVLSKDAHKSKISGVAKSKGKQDLAGIEKKIDLVVQFGHNEMMPSF